jgi:hypothetical protein
VCGIFKGIIFSLQELFEVAATDFIAGIVVVYHVLVQLLGDSWHVVNSFTHGARFLVTRSSCCLHRGLVSETLEVILKESSMARSGDFGGQAMPLY